MTHEIQEWQLDAIDAVMRRCDALSDFSSEQFMETLEKLGFTIARRTNQSASDRAMRNCSKITPHAAHDFTDYALLLRCPGVAGKPVSQKRGPSADLMFVDEVSMQGEGLTFTESLARLRGIRETEEPTTQNSFVRPLRKFECGDSNAHPPHDWIVSFEILRRYMGISLDTSVEGPEVDEIVHCPGESKSESFTLTPSGSVWVRRNTSYDDDMEGLIHDRATVVETYYKMRIDNNGRGRQFYVRYVDEDGKPHVRTQNGFLSAWEREKEKS